MDIDRVDATRVQSPPPRANTRDVEVRRVLFSPSSPTEEKLPLDIGSQLMELDGPLAFKEPMLVHKHLDSKAQSLKADTGHGPEESHKTKG